MSWLCVTLATTTPGTLASSGAGFPTGAALMMVLLPALLVTALLLGALRVLRRRLALPAWPIGLAAVGAFAIGAGAAVPGSVHLAVRTVSDWTLGDAGDARRATMGGLFLLPAWWIYTSGGRDDEALLRLEGPDGVLCLDPLAHPVFVHEVSRRLDGATVLTAIDRGLSPSGAERRDALPRALRGLATWLLAVEADALAASYVGLLESVSAVPAPRGLSASSEAAATWFLETHLPSRAWTLGAVAAMAFLGLALLLTLPLVVVTLRASRQ